MKHKGLKFLVDVGVGKKTEKLLQEHGYDTKNVRDINPRMSDKRAKIVEKILAQYSDKILNKFSVFKDGKLRIRK